MKKEIDKLSMKILKNSGVYCIYSDMDLMNATTIFMEVFLAKLYDKHKGKLSQEELEKLATEAGKSLHQTVKIFTGVDLKKVLK